MDLSRPASGAKPWYLTGARGAIVSANSGCAFVALLDFSIRPAVYTNKTVKYYGAPPANHHLPNAPPNQYYPPHNHGAPLATPLQLANQYSTYPNQDSHYVQPAHNHPTDPAYQPTGGPFRHPPGQSNFVYAQSHHTAPPAPAANYASRPEQIFAGSAALSRNQVGHCAGNLESFINMDPASVSNRLSAAPGNNIMLRHDMNYQAPPLGNHAAQAPHNSGDNVPRHFDK
jgi:hypothetical protein